eukprot:3441079-Rhodomonas_salina.2
MLRRLPLLPIRTGDRLPPRAALPAPPPGDPGGTKSGGGGVACRVPAPPSRRPNVGSSSEIESPYRLP